MVGARTFGGFDATEWTAIAAVASVIATLVLVGVTARYVRLTNRLVQATTAGLPVAFDVKLTAFNWVGHPDGTLGPFPDLVKITSLGTRLYVHAVRFDGTRGDPTQERLGGMVGDVPFLDPPSAPVSLRGGEVLYCRFEGSWALQPPDQEVAVTIEFSLTPRGTREEHTARVRASDIRSLPWGRKA